MNLPRPISSTQAYVGIQYGYIVIPPDVDRAAFIDQCFRWERVSILIENGGGVAHECYITCSAIQEIEFPLSSDALGSCVLFITDIHSGLPVVFGVLSKEDESQLLGEGIFKIKKIVKGNSVVITGDANKGVLNLSVDGGDLTQLNVMVANSAKNAIINIRCRGDVKLEMDGTFKVNKGSQAMVKGTELKTQLDATNTYLSNLYTALYAAFQALDAVVPGVSAAFQASMAGKNPGNYTNIKSAESFLD